jgi:hypothetical protein
MLILSLGVDPSAADARYTIFMSVLDTPMSKYRYTARMCTCLRALFSGFFYRVKGFLQTHGPDKWNVTFSSSV